jgi:hypothetical protein
MYFRLKITIAIITVAILSFHAASQMVFGVLGSTPDDLIWSYLVSLFWTLLADSISVFLMLVTKKSRLFGLTIALSALIAGAWLGFYYGGTIFGGKNPQMAIAAATILALIISVASFYWRYQRLTIVLVTVMGTIAAYGWAFLCAAAAFAFLSTNNFWWGSIWGCLCLGAIALIGFFLNDIILEVGPDRVRSFRA